MTIDDLEAVYEIECASFPQTSWNIESFLRELTANQFSYYFVIEKEDSIVGYCGMWLVIDQSQITTIAVSSREQGQGYGRQLMQHAKSYAEKSADILSLEVSVDNEKAMKLYEKEGFLYGGIRKDYYGPGKDAHVMWVKLNE
ncbi:ribosomal protein S18-alanine N-acetyltransferase [Salinicoccus hispanicus]|uniref:[Ribosomal protein bS18]-alanine N-acetyltransferase n=2 Tax=Salinicoccus hispanicus TaxID=157225 RepID=A0A6N8U719_9STAP|nr:ribosomal protein S18-alanine N-acetyltransferase [Salinicoccus hispanicus]